MTTAGEAWEWARTALRGIGDSLDTPLRGVDGDDIDWSAYFTYWCGAFKYAASVLGLPSGDYPHSRPPPAHLGQAEKPRSTRPIAGSG